MFYSNSSLQPVVSQPTAANFTFPSQPLLRRRETRRYQRIAPSSSLYNLPPPQARKEWASGEDPGIKLRRRRKRRQAPRKKTAIRPILARPQSATEAAELADILLEISQTHDVHQIEEPVPVRVIQVPSETTTTSTTVSRAVLDSTSPLHESSVANNSNPLETLRIPLESAVHSAANTEVALEPEPSEHFGDIEIYATPSANVTEPQLSAVDVPELTQRRKSSRLRKRNNCPPGLSFERMLSPSILTFFVFLNTSHCRSDM